ncbi:MAG: selenocysteine-specific translation elongation factor [Bacillota bacterium]
MEKNLIIGTAGHIDHGKTTLIKALTGDDTDRLEEEKERGISIELGFSDLEFDNGMQLGIIDVPGHEKFIKNMLAGAGGVDIALLVVSADEGVMAQTEEHLAILDLLNIKRGIIALSKVDKVEKEWLELVKEDTKDKLKGTFLEGEEIVEVSSIENIGINKLKKKIMDIALSIEDKDPDDNVYYPIDRVFSLSGHGTVITGTLVSGKISVEDKLTIYPQEKEVRIRSLQVHNESADVVYPGQRVGINVAGIDKKEINRGDVLATTDSLEKTDFIDGRLNILENSPMILEHGDRIRFHIGAREILGRVYMIEKEKILPGENALVQFRLEEEIVARYRENFVIRRYSPMTTIGGGVVIDNNPPYRKKLDKKALTELKIKEKGSKEDRVTLELKLEKEKPLNKEILAKNTNISLKNINDIIEILIKKNKIIELSNGNEKSYLHKENYDKLKEEIFDLLKEYHEKYSLRLGFPKEELREKISFVLNKKEFDQILKNLEIKNKIKIREAKIALNNFEIEYNSKQRKIKNELIKIFENNFMPPTIDQLNSELKYNEDEILEVFNVLVNKGLFVKIAHKLYFHKNQIDKAKELLINYLKENESIELSEFRDLLESSRKYALPLLEYFDQKKFLIRDGDKRKLNK